MFKLKEKYETFLGNEIEETFRFNFSETELLKQAQTNPLFNAEVLSVIMTEQKAMDMYNMMLELVLLSYGELSDDAKHFRKSEELKRDFEQSAAFNQIVDHLMNDPDLMKKFVIEIFPAKFAEELSKKANNITSIEDLKTIQG